jgi:hypothetical protein
MKQLPLLFILVSVIAFLEFNGCWVYSTLQDAKVMEPGKGIIGVGAAFPADENGVGVAPEIAARIGIFKRFDAGIKYSFPSLFFIDGKYQILDKSIYLAADLGWSYFSYHGTLEAKDKGTTTAWYPMLIAGQDHWYVAIKEVYFQTKGEFEFFGTNRYEGSGFLSTNVTLGAIIGSDFRLIPEINFIIPTKGSVLFVPALGLQIKL